MGNIVYEGILPIEKKKAELQEMILTIQPYLIHL